MLTNRAHRALNFAGKLAEKLHSPVKPEHILFGLAKEAEGSGGIGGHALAHFLITPELIEKNIFDFTTNHSLDSIFKTAEVEAKNENRHFLGTEHLLLAILKLCPECTEKLGVPAAQIATYVASILATEPDDMLDRIFEMQAQLNKRVGFDANALLDTFDSLTGGKWLNEYIDALSNELEELRNCTYWKFWSEEGKTDQRFAICDLQNARVEVADILFFTISLAQCLGLTAQQLFELYKKKWEVNNKRQDDKYSMDGKNEKDNKSV